ncbi:dimethylargininase [Streptomyces litchfieldiae]|uniref:Arginine deiminase-related protein n=1 Tax=Streptomyces litchfieldiae TaxID=3075543 RepID=A0ABU2N1V5_9ACTN|nr:dimethylargininase [Streptomyces sp. DSM 44938]MDT0347755.1 arginine deiminase-related protein [Streptomyces sp. DSM 44938]
MPAPRVRRPRRFLTCEPRYFDVRYAINPWMREDTPVDTALALDQWHSLVRAYRDHGHTVETVAPLPDLPDMVFAANAAVVLGGRVLGSRFAAPQRQPESAAYELWFKNAGFDVHEPQAVCEGEGDLVPVGPYLLAGTGFRTAPAAHAEAQEFFGVPVVGLRLADPLFYHLDTALFALDDGQDDPGAANVAYYPAAFTPGSRAVLERLFPDAVLATEEDAMAFGLNSVSDGRHVFIAAQAHGLAERLARRGYVPVPLDLSELRKAGGGIKCCTQEIRP